MSPKGTRQLVAGLVAVVLGVAITGCLGPGGPPSSAPMAPTPAQTVQASTATSLPAAPTITPQASTASETPQVPQAEGAEQMYACLVDAGLPAVLLDQDAGLAMVSWDDRLVAGAVLLTPASPEVLLFGDTSGIVVPPDFASTPALPYRLLLDGVDHSALYSDCVAASGYQAPREGPADSYADELTEKAALAQVTNEWASCARANGLSDVTDAAAPTVDSWTTVPVALLAPTTTVESLRSALAACPNYDFDRLAAAPNKYHDRDQPGWRPDPNIAVDANWDQLDQTETTHVEALYTVLFERLNQVSAAAGLPGNDGPERQPGT